MVPPRPQGDRGAELGDGIVEAALADAEDAPSYVKTIPGRVVRVTPLGLAEVGLGGRELAELAVRQRPQRVEPREPRPQSQAGGQADLGRGPLVQLQVARRET